MMSKTRSHFPSFVPAFLNPCAKTPSEQTFEKGDGGMFKKLTVILMVLAISGFASADNWWDGGGDGTSWSDIGNWEEEGGSVPGASDTIWIDNLPGGYINVNVTGSQSVSSASLGNSWSWQLEGQHVLNVSGTLTVVNQIGVNADSSVYAGSQALLNVTGTVTATGLSVTGDQSYANIGGLVALSDTTQAGLVIGNTGAAVYMTGGTITMPQDHTVEMGLLNIIATDGSLSITYDFWSDTTTITGSGSPILIPEPTTIALLGLGGLALIRKRY